MRFVPSLCLRKGMILGDDLYGRLNELMLSKGQIITEEKIDRIRKLGYQGVYVSDKLSDDSVLECSISSRLKNSAVSSVSKLCEQMHENACTDETIAGIKTAIYDIVDEIVENRSAVFNMIDLKIYDEYTYFHCINVAVLATIIGRAMDIKRNDLYKLALGSALHDIGKVFIPKEILEKPGKLTQHEFSIIRQHSGTGSRYLREKWDIAPEAHFPVLTHHERYDGTGYPLGIKNDKIPLFGKIAAVADVYDALTSDRPYRKALLPSEAMEHIMGGSGNMFDPDVVKTFLREISPYPVGTCVMLSNGMRGIVVQGQSKCGTRPKIKIQTDTEPPVYYDLYNDLSLLHVTIREITYF